MFLTELLRLFLFEYVSVKSIKTAFCFLICNPKNRLLISNALANQLSSILVCHKKQNKKIRLTKRKISMKLFTLSLIEKR